MGTQFLSDPERVVAYKEVDIPFHDQSGIRDDLDVLFSGIVQNLVGFAPVARNEDEDGNPVIHHVDTVLGLGFWRIGFVKACVDVHAEFFGTSGHDRHFVRPAFRLAYPERNAESGLAGILASCA